MRYSTAELREGQSNRVPKEWLFAALGLETVALGSEHWADHRNTDLR